MAEHKKNSSSPPEISPYVLPVVLAIMGLWFFYDGWITSNPDMQKHLLFNRVGSVVLLLWAAVDYIRTWRYEKEYNKNVSLKSLGDRDVN